LRGKINASPAVVDVIILITCGIITVAGSVCAMTFRSFPTFYSNAKKLAQKSPTFSIFRFCFIPILMSLDASFDFFFYCFFVDSILPVLIVIGFSQIFYSQ